MAAGMNLMRERALQSRDAIELLADKWRIPILHVLREGPLRSSELHAAITEISAKVLTQTLRAMERDGLIARKVQTKVPRRVEYSLTPMGASVLEPLAQFDLANAGTNLQVRGRKSAAVRSYKA